MELYSAEVAKANTLVKEWFTQPTSELEATFGFKGQVDVQTFLTVAARLRSKGLEGVSQQDKLNICLPDHVRFSLVGLGVIQQYCRDDILAGKPFVAMIKDRSSGSESNLDLQDYDVRIKARRELPMAQDDARVKDILGKWENQRKAFRLIRRWTYKGTGIKFDLSMVRSTERDTRGEFRWVRKFKDQRLLKSAPIYEIEVELDREAFKDAEDAYKALMRGIGEVLRGIQRSPILIRKAVAKQVLGDYTALVGTDRFRGVAPVTLERDNMSSEIAEGEPNIREGYNVTDKADGLRVLAFTNSKGELFLIDMGRTVYRTGLRNPALINSLLDGEWVTRDNDDKAINQLLLFDIYKDKGNEDVTKLPFQGGRHSRLEAWVQLWQTGLIKSAGATLLVAMKKFLFAAKGSQIFTHASRILDTPRPYFTDGLIFTPNEAPLPQKAGATFESQFKWKPSEDNTIDFLVQFEKDPEYPTQDKVVIAEQANSGTYVRYKVMRLLVGSSRDPAFDDPRTTVLMQLPLTAGEGKYKGVLFNPKEHPDTMASVCYRNVELDPDTGEEYVLTERSKEPIRDKSIVEIRYDPTQPPGWRWIPIRVRADKTDRLLRGEIARTLNSEKVAESVWNSIHDPVTESMIRTGADQPAEEEVRGLSEGASAIKKAYYDRKAPQEDISKVRGLRDFHNLWIKDQILYRSFYETGPNRTIIDCAVGKGGDLKPKRLGKAAFVLGIDAAGENIRDPSNGAYKRYLDTMVRFGKDRVPPMVFVIGQSQLPWVNGESGATPEERDILRSVFGRIAPEGSVPPFVEQNAAGRLRNGADGVTCQFALHYFFENEATFDGLLENIRQTLKIGGMFFGAAFDGERVFELLRGLPDGGSRSGIDANSVLWTITKKYSADEIPVGEAAFGMGIDVEFVSIGTPHREYLIPFNLLVEKMKTIGCELLDKEDQEKLGLHASSATFDVSYEMAKKRGRNFVMSDAAKQFSFLNRWFVFKRVSEGVGVQADVPSAAEEAALEREALAVEEAEEGEVKVNEVSAVPRGPGSVETVARGTAVKPGSEVAAAPSVEPEPVAAATVALEGGPFERTVAVAEGTAAPGAAASALKTYAPAQIFYFYMGHALQDKLKIGDKGASRWVAPGSPFPIADADDPSILYPSVEHYYAAKRLELASNKPELGGALFGRDGSIHQKYVRERLKLTDAGAKKLSEDKDFELLDEEIDEVRKALKPAELRKYGAVVDEAKWATAKNGVLRDALRYRLEKDARLRRVLDAAREQGKTLVYYTGNAAASELGAVRRADGRLDGENKVGKFLMELAGGFDI